MNKRRIARSLNQLFERLTAIHPDGRTEKRRQRLLLELREGKRGKPLAATDVVSHASELLRCGETLASIRKNGVIGPGLPDTDEAYQLALELQTLNDYDRRAWKVLGLDLDVRAKASARTARAKSTTAKSTTAKSTTRMKAVKSKAKPEPKARQQVSKG